MSGMGEIDLESSRTLILTNLFESGKKATVITLDTTNRYIQDAYFRIANYSRDYTENSHGSALTGSRAYYQTEINGSYTENRFWNRYTQADSKYSDAQIASVTSDDNGVPYSAVHMSAFSMNGNGNAIEAWINISTQGGGVYNLSAFNGNIEIQAWSGRVNIRQDIGGRTIDGTVVVSTDFGQGVHPVTLGWDGSRLILYVDNVFIGYVSTTK